MTQTKQQFIDISLKKYGATIKGEVLAKELGYGSKRSLDRAVLAKKIPVRLYPLHVGKGRYAKTVDVAEYLWNQQQGGKNE